MLLVSTGGKGSNEGLKGRGKRGRRGVGWGVGRQKSLEGEGGGGKRAGSGLVTLTPVPDVSPPFAHR